MVGSVMTDDKLILINRCQKNPGNLFNFDLSLASENTAYSAHVSP